MNVLWVSPYSIFGGPHNAIVHIAEPLRARGWESLVLLPDDPGNAAERLESGGVETVPLSLHHLRATPDPRVHLGMAAAFRREVTAIEKLLTERRCDLVVLTGVDVQAAVAARRTGVAIVWQVAASRPPRPVRAGWMTLIRRWADVVMFSGEEIERMYVRKRPVAQPSFQIDWPVDTKRFRPAPDDGAAARAKLGVPADALLVGSVANLVPMKGIEYFIRASALVYASRPDSWFLISGSTYPEHAGYPARLRDEVRASGVPPDRFVWVDGPPDDVYPALDLMLIASLPRSEGMPTTALESMACETPVVATDVASVPEAVLDGVTGAIVPSRDAEALAAATLELAGDPQKLRALGVNGRRRVMERFNVEQFAELHVKAFDAALSRHR